jgi:hypothetical protein
MYLRIPITRHKISLVARTRCEHQINSTSGSEGMTVRIPTAYASHPAISGYVWQIIKRKAVEALVLKLLWFWQV